MESGVIAQATNTVTTIPRIVSLPNAITVSRSQAKFAMARMAVPHRGFAVPIVNSAARRIARASRAVMMVAVGRVAIAGSRIPATRRATASAPERASLHFAVRMTAVA